MQMVEAQGSDEMSVFMKSGIFRFENNSNVVFMDPVRVLNCSYSHYRVSPSAYYSRFFESKAEQETRVSERSRKRKRKRKEKKSNYALNEREQSADQRHQEARPLLFKAYEALQRVKDLLLSNLKSTGSFSVGIKEEKDVKQSFIELGSVWQAPMYQISLYHQPRDKSFDEDAGLALDQSVETRVMPVFNNLIMNETTDDMEAEFLNHSFLLTLERHILSLPYKVISTHYSILHKAKLDGELLNMYPTLPGRYFLSLPIKQLTHTEGALVALWVTNKEKLRSFIEKELFPMWGVSHTATFYWLKVKADGSLISELDLFHHRPYECLLLGYCHRDGMESIHPSTFKPLQENHVIISIPGEYSRKPPLWKLLLQYVPGRKPARCIELFARELFTGWTSWGNEPLHFQESKYFINSETESTD